MAVQLKPLTAIVQDVLAHTFWKVHHLATTHHQHGHHHLDEELQDISEDDHDAPHDKIPTHEKSKEDISFHILLENAFRFKNHSLVSAYPKDSHKELAVSFISIVTPPPKG